MVPAQPEAKMATTESDAGAGIGKSRGSRLVALFATFSNRMLTKSAMPQWLPATAVEPFRFDAHSKLLCWTK